MSPKQERQINSIKRASQKLGVFRNELATQLHTDALESLLEVGLLSFGVKPTETEIAAGDAIRIFLHVDKCLDGSALSIATLTHATQIATITADILLYRAHQFPPKQAHAYRVLRPIALSLVGAQTLQSALGAKPYPGGLEDAVISFVKAVSYETSALLADTLGAFPLYQSAAQAMIAAITNHRAAAFGNGNMLTDSHIRPPMLREGHVPALLLTKTRERWNTALSLGRTNGYRHAKTVALTVQKESVVAPISVPKDIEQKWQSRTPLSQEELHKMLQS